MENAINTLRIQNFKSIKDVTMKPRRVNLIIGQPNVGKSNILEAMSLLGAGLYDNGKRLLGDVVRYEGFSNLFYDDDTKGKVMVESSISKAILERNHIGNGHYQFVQVSNNVYDFIENQWAVMSELEGRGTLDTKGLDTMIQGYIEEYPDEQTYSFFGASVEDTGVYKKSLSKYSTTSILPKKYVYRTSQPHDKEYQYSFLMPPAGWNLLEVVQQNPLLRKQIVELFKPYHLQLVLRVKEHKFEIQKNINDFIYNYPYSSIADTLQRIIFYLAAIESNDDSVLLFEEPEAHTFPVYTTMLGQKIAESRNNQFFVATHSPYLLTEIIENLVPQERGQELAIFLAYYEDYQTKIYQLTDEEVGEIRRDAIDVFYNLSRYTPHANPYA